jgi:Amidohydrolase family
VCIVCGSGSAHLLRAIARANAPRPAPRFVAAAVAPPVVPPLDPAQTADLAGPADVILRGGPILTMNPAQPRADAIAVRKGRIRAVGSAPDALAHRGRLTRVIDLQGRWLLPGFVNAHWHMPFTLLCEWVEAGTDLADAVRDAPEGEWIVVQDSPKPSPARAGGADANPLVVVDPDGNILAGNALAGDLPAHVSELVPRFPVSHDAIRRRLKNLLRQTAATGVTCLRVCGLGTLAGAEDLDLLHNLAEAAPLRLRATLDANLWPEWKQRQLSPGFGDDAFRVDTLSAWLADPADAAPLAARLWVAGNTGWAITVHAADAAESAAVLHAFGRAATAFDHRSGIECRAAPPPDDLAAIARHGLSLGLGAAEPVTLPDAFGPPVSLGLDAATGPSAPLHMLANATPHHLALAAVTIGAARRCGVDAILGSLEPGKYADFAFLDRDPADPAAACVATWVGGRDITR